MAELLRTCLWWLGGLWWWISSKNLVTSDRLVVRKSVGLGQRGSDNNMTKDGFKVAFIKKNTIIFFSKS